MTALPPPLDQPDWEKAATEYAIGSLDRIRTSAEKWAGTVGTLLGLFGTVAIVAGPDAFRDLPSDARAGVLGSIALAAILAGAAIVLASLAAQGTTRIWENWNGYTFAAYVAENGTTAAGQLKFSRWLGLFSASVLLLTGLTATWTTLSEDRDLTPTKVLVVTESGALVCGELGTSGENTTVGGQELEDARWVTVVDGC